PVTNFAPPAFDVTQRHAIGWHFPDLCLKGAGGQLVHHLPNNAQRLEEFFAAHDHAALHVPFGKNRHGELHLVVEVVREVATQVVVETGCPAGDAHDAEVARDFGLEHAGGFG